MTLKLQTQWIARLKLRAEGDKIRAEGDKIWVDAVRSEYGNTKIRFDFTGRVFTCTLGNGDVYREDMKIEEENR